MIRLRSTGLLRDDGRHPLRGLRATRAHAPLRGSADLTRYAGTVLDQGDTSSCVGCGLTSAAAITLAAAGTPLRWTPSVLACYQLALRLDRAHDYPLRDASAMPALQDCGTQLRTGALVLSRYGVGPSQRGAACDATPSTVRDEHAVHLGTLIATHQTLLCGAFALDVSNRAQLQQELEEGHAIAIGGWVDSDYMQRTPRSAPAGAQRLHDSDGGGHCQVIVGYRADAWHVRNSWGAGWGDGGYTWVTDAFIEQLWECYSLDVSLAA
jgi:hypothetical protein